MVGSVKKISVVILLLNFLLTSFPGKLLETATELSLCVFSFLLLFVCSATNQGTIFFKKTAIIYHTCCLSF